jgi:glycosyltransferase involved in cell wall biosynthesis
VSEEAKSAHIPLITVGIVVLNREWIIDKVLGSVLSQTYPHNRIYVVIVDGESKDKTIEIAKKTLEKSDFNSYDIIVRKTSIPEGRNICIEKMQGDALLFWDSDVIMGPNAIQELVDVMEKQKADIVTGNALFIFVDRVSAVEAKVEEAMKSQPTENHIQEVLGAGMGHTLISRNVLSRVRFDPDFTILEDIDFSARARDRGFKIVTSTKILAVDVNIIDKRYSDIHVDMPLENAMRGMRKKARAQVLVYRPVFNIFLRNKRYAFYLGYVPAAILTCIGILLNNLFLIVIFPSYLLLFTFWQMKRRGLRRGSRAISRSFLVGVPTSLWIAYYVAKYTVRKRQL